MTAAASVAGFVWDPRLAAHVYRADHPLKPRRLRGVHDTLVRLGAFSRPNARLLAPRDATRAELERVHDGAYVDAVAQASADPDLDYAEWGLHTFGDTPPFAGMHEASLLTTGASLVAMEAVVSGPAPGRAAGYRVTVALPPCTDDPAYIRAFDAVVPPLVGRYRPDVLVTQQGIDPHFLDPLADLRLSTHAREHVVGWFARTPYPWVAMGGGGYDLDAVRRTWSLEYLLMLGAPVPDELHDQDPPVASGPQRAAIDTEADAAVREAVAAALP